MSKSWSWHKVLVALVITVVALAALPAASAQQSFGHGAVVALQGTPHLWIADEHGALHWGGDTRALAGKHVNWGDRTEVSLAQLRTLPVGDPWLSAGLLKDGDPIYLVKWESDWAQPQLLHIQSIADVELFGINGSNYGNFVIEKSEWERRYGMSAAGLQRGVLAAAAPVPAPQPAATPVPPHRGKAVTGSITTCSGNRNSITRIVTVTIEGTLQAHRSVRHVMVTGKANGTTVGVDIISSIAAGHTANFRITGITTTSASTLDCSVSVEWLEFSSS